MGEDARGWYLANLVEVTLNPAGCRRRTGLESGGKAVALVSMHVQWRKRDRRRVAARIRG